MQRGALSLWLLAVTSCASGVSFEKIDRGALPKAEDHEGEHGIILFESRRVRFYERDGKAVADETLRGRHIAFDDDGRWLYSIGTARSSFSEPVTFAARVTRPDGSEERFDLDDAIDVPAYSWELYSDERLLALDLRDMPLGSVVEFEMTRRVTEPKLFQLAHGFGHGVPVQESRFEVVHPPGWQVEHLVQLRGADVDEAPVAGTTPDGEQQLSWVKRDLARLEGEPFDGGAYGGVEVRARLKAWTEGGAERQAFADEKELSRWLWQATDEKSTPTPEVAQLAAEALVGVPDDPTAKSRRLYSWVRDNVRYCAIEIGMGGFIPHEAAKTERLRYGDCKDKANLLRAMLRSQGIGSHLALIYSHGGLPKRFTMPTLGGNFNHAILEIELPGGALLVDPTTRTVPFGRLPAGDQGADLLPSTKEGAALRSTPVSTPSMNVLDTELSLRVAPGQRLVGRFRLRLDGIHADAMRGDLLAAPEAGHPDVVKHWLRLKEREVTDLSIEGGAPPLEPEPVVITGAVEAARVRADDRLLFRVSRMLWRAAQVLADEGEREGPILLGSPERRHDVVRLTMPAGAVLVDPPAPVTLESDFGKYDLSIRQEGDEIVVERTLLQAERIVPARRYAELKAFHDEIHRAESLPHVVRLAGARQTAAAEAAP